MATNSASEQAGYAAHIEWEKVRGDENECDAEKRLSEIAESAGLAIKEWWDGWFMRSDAWRDEIGHEG
jgi:hypothetical protein